MEAPPTLTTSTPPSLTAAAIPFLEHRPIRQKAIDFDAAAMLIRSNAR